MKGSRTILFNLLALALALLDLFVNDGSVLSSLFSKPEHAVAALAVLKIANVVLRFVTTTPVFTKEAPEASGASPAPYYVPGAWPDAGQDEEQR